MIMVSAIIAGFAVLFLAIPFSMVGQGGGSTYVPVLVAAGMEFHEAATTSLFMIMLASVAASLVFGRKKTIDWRLLLAIIPFAIAGSFIGGYLAQSIDTEILKILFAAVLGVAAFFMLRPVTEGQCPAFIPHRGRWARSIGEYRYEVPIGLLIPATALAGFVAGLIGVGGGLFLLPMLVLLFGCPTRISIGISSTYVGIIALPGFIGHLAGGSPFNFWAALPLAGAAFIGATLGPMLSLKFKVARLRTILAVVLIGLAGWMLINIF